MKKIFIGLLLVFFSDNSFADTNLHDLLETYKRASPDFLINDKSAYQSENPSCKAEAFLAAWIVAGKNQGVSYKDARTFIRSYSMNNPGALEITRQLYKEDFAKHFSIQGAYSGYGADCDTANQSN